MTNFRFSLGCWAMNRAAKLTQLVERIVVGRLASRMASRMAPLAARRLGFCSKPLILALPIAIADEYMHGIKSIDKSTRTRHQ